MTSTITINITVINSKLHILPKSKLRVLYGQVEDDPDVM